MELVKDFRIVLIFALLCGILFSLPSILMPVMRNDALYTPLVVKGVNAYTYDQTMYASSIRDVVDGHYVVRDPVLYESKGNASILIPIFPAVFLGVMSILLGSVQMTYVVGSFIFPLISFLLVYFLFHMASKSRDAAILAALFVMIGFNFVLTPPLTPQNIQFHVNEAILYPINAINYLNRLPAIQFVFVELMIAVILMYLMMERKSAKYAVLCGISIGVLFYSYTYYWVGLAMSGGLLFLWALYRKDMYIVKSIAIVAVVAAAISLPYWVDLLSFASTPEYFDVGSRVGMTERFSGLHPILTLKYAVFLAIFAYFVKKRDNFFRLAASVLISGIVALNIQLITGFSVQPEHYDFAFLGPLSAMLLVYIFVQISSGSYRISPFLRSNSRKIFILFATALLAFGLYSHTAYSMNAYKSFGLSTEYREAYDWLNNNTERDSVVATMSTEQNLLLTVYTHNNVFIPNGFLSPVSDEETLDRLFTVYKIFNVTPEYLSWLMDNEKSMSEYTGVDIYPRKFNVSLFEKTYWSLYPFHAKFTMDGDLLQSELPGEKGTKETYAAMLE